MRIYVAILSIVCLLFSCSNEKESEPKTPSIEIWQKEAIAFLSNETSLLSFGAINIDQILTKAIYDSKLSESGLVPEDMIEDYSKVIYTQLPMYYAIKNVAMANVSAVHINNPDAELILKDITTPEVVLVCKIKSASLAIETMKKDFQMGEIIEENGVKFLFNRDVKIGLTENEMIISMSQNNDNKRAKTAIKNTIDGLKSKKNKSEIAQTIAAKDDITFAINMEEIHKSLTNVMHSEVSEPNELLKGAIAMHLSFEKGKIVLTNKNYLPKQVLGLNIFAKDSKAMLKKLGAGSPITAITLALDMQGLEKLQKQYLPKSISNAIQDSELDANIKNLIPRELSVIEAFIQKNGVQNYIDGNLAFGEYLVDEKNTEYSAYLGIGPDLEEILKNEFNPMKGFFHSLEIDDTRMELYTSEINGPQNNISTLQLKPEFKDLGAKPISAFLDIESHPYKELLGNDKVTERIFDLCKHITLNADLKGGILVLTMKDEQSNAMTQIANLIPSLIFGSLFQ